MLPLDEDDRDRLLELRLPTEEDELLFAADASTDKLLLDGGEDTEEDASKDSDEDDELDEEEDVNERDEDAAEREEDEEVMSEADVDEKDDDDDDEDEGCGSEEHMNGPESFLSSGLPTTIAVRLNPPNTVVVLHTNLLGQSPHEPPQPSLPHAQLLLTDRLTKQDGWQPGTANDTEEEGVCMG